MARGFCHGICNIIIIIINLFSFLFFFLPPIPPTYLKIISSFLNLNLILNMYDMELTSIICRTKNSRSYRAICCAQFPVVLKNWSSSWVFSLTPPVNMKRSLSLKARIFSFVSFSEKNVYINILKSEFVLNLQKPVALSTVWILDAVSQPRGACIVKRLLQSSSPKISFVYWMSRSLV